MVAASLHVWSRDCVKLHWPILSYTLKLIRYIVLLVGSCFTIYYPILSLASPLIVIGYLHFGLYQHVKIQLSNAKLVFSKKLRVDYTKKFQKLNRQKWRFDPKEDQIRPIWVMSIYLRQCFQNWNFAQNCWNLAKHWKLSQKIFIFAFISMNLLLKNC